MQDFKYFMTVAETQNFSKAAEKLYLSQPYLSRWAAKLERELDITLFDRTRSPIKLTDDGLVFLEYASKMLELEREMHTRFSRDGKQIPRALSIGTDVLTGTYVLPLVIAQLVKKYPGLQIDVLEESAKEMESQISSGTMDLAFLSCPSSREDLQYEQVSDCRIIMVIPPGNPLYKEENCCTIFKSPFKTSDLKHCSFLTAKSTPGTHAIAQGFLNSMNISIKHIGQESTIAMALRTCVRSNRIAFVPDTTISYAISGKLPNYYEIGEPPLTVPVFAVYQKMTPAVEDTIHWTREHWKSISAE